VFNSFTNPQLQNQSNIGILQATLLSPASHDEFGSTKLKDTPNPVVMKPHIVLTNFCH